MRRVYNINYNYMHFNLSYKISSALGLGRASDRL